MIEQGIDDMDQLPEYVRGVASSCGSEHLIDETTRDHVQAPLFRREVTTDPLPASTALAGPPCTCTSH